MLLDDLAVLYANVDASEQCIDLANLDAAQFHDLVVLSNDQVKEAEKVNIYWFVSNCLV